MFDINTPGWSREHDVELASTFLRGLARGTEHDYYRFGKALVRTARFLCDELEASASDASGDTYVEATLPEGTRAEMLAPAGSVRDEGEAHTAAKGGPIRIDISGEGPVPSEIMDLVRRLSGVLGNADGRAKTV